MSGDVDSVGRDGGQVPGTTATPRGAVTAALTKLVATLSLAREQAAARAEHADLGALLQRARAQLDLADEELLALDRNRARSSFRQAARIRDRLEAIEVQVIALNSPVPGAVERLDSAPPPENW